MLNQLQVPFVFFVEKQVETLLNKHLGLYKSLTPTMFEVLNPANGKH